MNDFQQLNLLAIEQYGSIVSVSDPWFLDISETRLKCNYSNALRSSVIVLDLHKSRIFTVSVNLITTDLNKF